MKHSACLILIVMLLGSGSSTAQTPTVTGKDLEKFREKRLKAEREYRENYERIGMPSPEELERRRVEDKKTLLELSDKYRQERLELAARQAEFAWRAYEASQRQTTYDIRVVPYNFGHYYSPYFSYGHLPYKVRHRGHFSWRAGGGGVVYEPGGLSSFIWSAPRRAGTSRIRQP